MFCEKVTPLCGIFVEEILRQRYEKPLQPSSQHQRSPVNIIDPEYSISKYTLLVSLKKQIRYPRTRK